MSKSLEVQATPKGHPPGLYLLFTTEMWERFSYYGMRALLVLYLVDKSRGGFGWSASQALSLYGWYTALVYFTPLLGGWLADRSWGQRRAVLVGGILIMAGHFLLAVPGYVSFYGALGLLIAGCGLLKANISTMVGSLYPSKDPRRDSGFTLFYMGINVGGFFGPLLCGFLGERVGWHIGFAAAGVGMALGLAVFLIFQKRWLGTVGLPPSGEHKKAVVRAPFTREEKQRIAVILALALFGVVFWASFEQSGGLMNLYTSQKVNRWIGGWQVPATWLQSTNSLFILLLAPLFSAAWTFLAKRGREPHTAVKMAMAFGVTSLAFACMVGAARQSAAGQPAALGWIVGSYFLQTVAELMLSPVGLSMVSKLAPQRITSLLMGCWFLSFFVGNKLAGIVGGMAEKQGDLAVFGGIALVTLATGGVLLSLSGVLHRAMHGAEDRTLEPADASAA